MKKISIVLLLAFGTIVAYSQNHSANYTLDSDLKSDQWKFIVLEKGRMAINQTEISVDDYLTFLERVSNDSSAEYMNTLLPSKECALFPFINLENGFVNEDKSNPKKITWIDEEKFMSANNYPPKSNTKGIDIDALNPYKKPITGISFEQANEFAKWCTAMCNKKIMSNDEMPYRKIMFRLPTPKEFEDIERRGMEACTYKDKLTCDKVIAHIYAGKNEKGCALYNCAGKDTCAQNLFASKHMGNELYMVYGYNPSWIGLYNMPGNAAEMTSEKGIAKGGSYLQVAKDCSPTSVQKYDKPEKWLGFRLIAEVVDGYTMSPMISALRKENGTKPMEEGDYVLLKTANYPNGIFIFKSSGNYIEMQAEANVPEPAVKKPKKYINDLFANVEKLKIENMSSINDNVFLDGVDLHDYSIIEYNKNGQTYRVCWRNESSDNDVNKLNKFIDAFWKM